MSVYGRAWINIAKVSASVQTNNGVEVNGARDNANNFTSDGLSANDIVSSPPNPERFFRRHRDVSRDESNDGQ